MKKILIALGLVIVLVFAALAIVPIVFKEDIQQAIDEAIADAVDAEVYYDTDAFDLSLITNFPDFTLSVGNFGIAGKGLFATDTLVDVKLFELTIDVMSVINGEKIDIVHVLLDAPTINILVLEDGTANYDIAKATEATEATEEATGESGPINIGFKGWEIRNGKVRYDDRATPMKATIGGLNHTGSGDFATHVFDMITTTTVEDLSFGYDEVTYMAHKTLKAEVTLGMDLKNRKYVFKKNYFGVNGFGFGIDGFLSMPDEKIDIDIQFEGKDIDMKNVLSLVPGDYETYLDGVDASGSIHFDGFVKGTVADSTLPAVWANFQIENGKIDYVDAPVPMEDINIKSTFSFPSADLRETSFIVEKFGMRVEGEPFTASLIFKDLEDYFWDLKVDGQFDLGKVTQIVPLEGMELKGLLNAAFHTSGRMSVLEAEKYGDIDAAGSLSVTDFQYIANDLPQGFGIKKAAMSFDPKKISLDEFQGNAGKTDLNMSGKITNYLAYALQDDAVLSGKLDFNTKGIYADEWMTADDSLAEQAVDTATIEVVRVPENIDFVLASNIDLIDYDSLDLEDFKGKLFIKDGAVTLEKVSFNLLGGAFEIDGSYASASTLALPLYDLDFKIRDLSIAATFDAFNTVQDLAPFAEKMEGDFSTTFTMAGSMGEDMMPVYEDMQGLGTVTVAQAALQDVKLLKAASQISKLDAGDGRLELKDVDIAVEVKNGRVYVEPFEVTLGGRTTTISGSSGVDGSLDYRLVTIVPTGKAGSAINSSLSSFMGGAELLSGTLDMTLGVLGTYDDPQVKLLGVKPTGDSGSAGAKSVVKEKAKAELSETKQEVKEVVEETKEEVREQVKEEVKEVKEEVTKKAKKKLKGLLK